MYLFIIYVCMYYVRMCMYLLYMYVCMHVYVCMYVCMYLCIYVRMMRVSKIFQLYMQETYLMWAVQLGWPCH